VVYYINSNIYAVSEDSLELFLTESDRLQTSLRSQVIIKSLADIRGVESSPGKFLLVFPNKKQLNQLIYSYIDKISSDLSISTEIKNKVLDVVEVSRDQKIIETFDYSLGDAYGLSYELLLTAFFNGGNEKIQTLLYDKLLSAMSTIEREEVDDVLRNNRKQASLLIKQYPEFDKILSPHIDNTNPKQLHFSTLERVMKKYRTKIEADTRYEDYDDFFIVSDLLTAIKLNYDYEKQLITAYNGRSNYFRKRAFRINYMVL